MYRIKRLNEELSSNLPSYNRGEITLYSKIDLDENTVKDISLSLGYDFINKITDKSYLIKTKPGKEIESAQDFIDNYPEFFISYERENETEKKLYDELDNIISDIEDIRDSLGYIKKGKVQTLPKDWNDNIDNIIDNLNKLKY